METLIQSYNVEGREAERPIAIHQSCSLPKVGKKTQEFWLPQSFIFF